MKAIALAPKSGCVKATASGLLVAFPRGLQTATLSNCGDILKLQSAKPILETGRWPGRETLGTATTSADETMDNPQPSPNGRDTTLPMDAVHRLNGSGYCSVHPSNSLQGLVQSGLAIDSSCTQSSRLLGLFQSTTGLTLESKLACGGTR
jgi:hypothetical protein